MLKKWDALPKEMQNEKVRPYYEALQSKKFSLMGKRLFDIVMSLLGIICLSPVLIVLAILIKLDSKGPVLFTQERYTTYGKVFRIYKFRTMVVNADKMGSLVTAKQDARITKMGSKLRKLRLDELPQLFNILKGEMSFVGTRPEVKKYVDAYDEEMWATLLLPAGVTSIASIFYKDEDEILAQYPERIDEAYIQYVLPDKMKYNYEYLKDFSFVKDFKICIQTVLAVLK